VLHPHIPVDINMWPPPAGAMYTDQITMGVIIQDKLAPGCAEHMRCPKCDYPLPITNGRMECMRCQKIFVLMVCGKN
jgi:hypothetical protein